MFKSTGENDEQKNESSQFFHLFLVAASLLALSSFTTAAADPRTEEDGSWIVLSGEVEAAESPDGFVMAYSGGTIKVEMDNWNKFEYPGKVKKGDRVEVYGRVDNDTYETATVEARSVFVENLGIHFYGSAADEEALAGVDLSPRVPVVKDEVSVTGRVKSIDDRMFTIDTGNRQLTVDTSKMDYNPMKRPGLRSLEASDRVTATGQLTSGVFDLQKLTADSVVVRVSAPELDGEANQVPNPDEPATQTAPVLP
jgi:uncharacterized protein YdeI (BOF family)